MFQRPLSIALGFGFVILSACTSDAPEDSVQLEATMGNGAGGSPAVPAAGGPVAAGTGGSAAEASSAAEATTSPSGTPAGSAAGGSAAIPAPSAMGHGGAGGAATTPGNLGGAGADGTGVGGMAEMTGASGADAQGGGGVGAAGNASGGSAGTENGGASGGDPPTSCTPARSHNPGRTPVAIQHDGNDRDYVLFVPTGYDGTEPLPLVVNLHGGSSFATEELDRSKWDEMGEQENFVVVAPNGMNMSWNAGFGDDGRDDVGFIRAVVAEVAAALCIDEKRVYVSGHSNGGAMTHKLGCEAADLFAGMAPICGWTEMDVPCNPARSMSVAAVRSLDDPTVQYEGGGRAPSAAEDLQRWLDVNECEDMPVITSHDGMCTTHTSCKDGTQVMECHPPGAHGFYYQSNNPLPLPDTLWPFFEQFVLP